VKLMPLTYKLLLGLALGVMLATTSPAKSVDFSAHFDSEEYWSSHAIYLARVTDIPAPSTANGPYVTTFVPIKIIAGSVVATNRSFQSYPASPMIDGVNGDRPDNFPMGVSSDAILLVSEAVKYPQTTVVRVMQFPEDQALLLELEQIAVVRKDPGLKTLLAGAASPFDLEAGYCLNRLLTLLLPDQLIPAALLKPVQALADDEERPAGLRIAAEEVVLRYSAHTQSGQSEAEYQWLRGVIETAAANTNVSGDPHGDLDRLRPMFMKCFEFKDHQAETVDYVLRLASNTNAPAGLRNTACSALSSWDQQAFDFQSPDPLFDRMFNTYMELLKDPSPDLRIMGMSMLFDRTLTIMETQSPPERTREYGDKAVQALRQALAGETDARVIRYFQSRLDMYEDRQTHPERWRQIRELERNTTGTHGGAHP